MGYRRTQEMCSRATSPIEVAEEAPAVESCEQAEEDSDQLTQEQYAALSLQHAEELKELQDQYELVTWSSLNVKCIVLLHFFWWQEKVGISFKYFGTVEEREEEARIKTHSSRTR